MDPHGRTKTTNTTRKQQERCHSYLVHIVQDPMPSKFEALADDDESDGREEDFDNNDERLSDIPSYEDLSMTRVDEETVLSAVYGNDFVKKGGPWGSKIMSVIVRPPDISSSKVGSTVVLNIQIGKKYPYFQPKVNLSDVKGLSNVEQAELTKQLNERCLDLASNGSVMVCELVQVTEDFLHSHNIDPTMSAYDTMKAREAEEKKILMEKEKKLISFMDVDERKKIDRHFSDTGERYDTFDSAAKVRIQRELDRQDAALNHIHGNVPFNDLNDIHDLSDSEDLDMTLREEEDDDYDDDFQFDEPTNGKGSSSRYNSDFIELGLIGRGGGGTVFKVRNRLDRRIYAVKKVMLLSEQGKMNKVGKLENSKLRREVTTISRMTHRHIVRYYQAWVEGADKLGNEEGEDLEEVEDIAEGFLSEGDASKSQSDTSSKIGESEKGFWGKRPSSSTDLGNFRGESDDDPSWSSDISSTSISINESERRTKADMRAFDSDEESIFPGGPLLGFENHSYSDLFKAGVKKESTNSSSDDLGFHSSMMDQLSSQMLKGSNSILYIQMEYCPRQLMTLMGTIEHNQGFKMIRQVLEALVYIHKRKIIHRDLKPGNIFLDAEHNVRLGDFGLATTRTKKTDIVSPTSDGDDKKDHEKIDMDSLHDDTITGGVGTTFYIAPEQAGTQYSGKGRNDYDMKADIFSLGIIIFEMFFSFSTKMERATILMQLRGDTVGSKSSHHSNKEVSMSSISTQKDSIQYIVDSEDWRQVAKQRFPKAFMDTPENIQKLILWCLERSPEKRPSAEQLLASDLIPRQMDLDHRYLKEALQSIANPESDSHEQIIKALFNRNAMQHVEITYDTDDVAKAQKQIRSSKHGSRSKHPIELLGKSLDQIGGFTSGDVQGFHSSAMNLLSMSAATSTLRRARGAGKIAKGGVLRQSTQHAATVLAMCSATAAAATGHTVGINGADPRVIKYVCDQLTFIFESHGAIPLRPPLLRPKGENDSSTANGSTQPAEVINGRGHNLLLPEDLQVNFARTIGRGGGALSNVKRYEIGTSYLKSISGGHPRQFLEASFDIVLESQQSKSELFFAEIIMVICQAFNILSPRKDFNMDTSASTEIVHPMWILRLTHTRLADAILDICGVPAKEALRQFCYHILTCCSAPPPNLLWIKSSDGKKIRGKKRKDTKKVCNGLIDNAILDHGLPKGAAARLRAFLNSGCLPLPLDINAALIALRDGTKKLRSMDDQRHNIPRRQKRYEDVARGLNTIKKSIEALKIMEIKVSNEIIEGENHQFPAYICLDLGLRQPAQHYHGHIYFQAIMLPEGPQSIVSNDTLLSDEGNGIKIAEGGRFDELVRRFRPPGNFASSDVNKYTSAPIPVCTGVRFFIGPFVERIYVEAALRSRKESEKSTLLTSESDVLRRLLAIPDLLQKGSVQCLIVGANGFDSASLCERAMVASHLWSNGISAEFIPHSGVILSLLKRSAIDTGATVPDTNEWTLDQICDLCCLLHIPFVVVVQQHLLRERKSVRLRQTTDLSSVQNGCHEKFVHLNNIASEIKEILSSSTRTLRSIPNDKNEYDNNIPASPFDRQSSTIQRETSTIRPRSISTSSPDLEYIYVDSDQFYLDPDKTGSGKDPKLKNILKVIKKVQLKADSFIQNELHKTFITVELPFRICREFNSIAMFGSGISIVASTADFQTKHPKYRKTLKTFAMCLDFMVRRFSESTSSSGSSNTGSRSSHKESILSILVYAQADDRFDLLTLDVKHDSMNVKQSDSSSHKKKERSGRYR